MKENSKMHSMHFMHIPKRRIIVTHSVSGMDKRKEAVDFILKNSK